MENDSKRDIMIIKSDQEESSCFIIEVQDSDYQDNPASTQSKLQMSSSFDISQSPAESYPTCYDVE